MSEEDEMQMMGWKRFATVVSMMALGCVAEEGINLEEDPIGERRSALELQGASSQATPSEGSPAKDVGRNGLLVCSESDLEGRNPGESSCVIPDFGEACGWAFPNECSDLVDPDAGGEQCTNANGSTATTQRSQRGNGDAETGSASASTTCDGDPCPCINVGFQALGSGPTTDDEGNTTPGTKGDVDGPGRKGNGTYEVLENSCYRVSMKVETGYMDLTLTLESTAKEPCTVTATSSGTVKGETVDGTVNLRFEYDAEDDEGSFTPIDEDGEEIADTDEFWDGAGGDDMTIEFDTYNHDFSHD